MAEKGLEVPYMLISPIATSRGASMTVKRPSYYLNVRFLSCVLFKTGYTSFTCKDNYLKQNNIDHKWKV